MQAHLEDPYNTGSISNAHARGVGSDPEIEHLRTWLADAMEAHFEKFGHLPTSALPTTLPHWSQVAFAGTSSPSP
ncbi:hypothetical protein EON68_02505 [archaeon]|nr:MAG: hypothetical protein EON68_02505 [archaeon]